MSDSVRPHRRQPTRLPSLGFSRQQYWSGLPFSSPMHESEKWKWCRSVESDSLRPHGLQPTRLLRTWDFPGKSTGVGCHCLLKCPRLTTPISTEVFNLWMQTHVTSNHAKYLLFYLINKYIFHLWSSEWRMIKSIVNIIFSYLPKYKEN